MVPFASSPGRWGPFKHNCRQSHLDAQHTGRCSSLRLLLLLLPPLQPPPPPAAWPPAQSR
jgi:hypothetical protein